MTDTRSKRKQKKRNIAGEAGAAVVLGCICAILGVGIGDYYLVENNNREVTVSVSDKFESNADSYVSGYATESMKTIEAGTGVTAATVNANEYITPAVTAAPQFPDSDFIFPHSSTQYLTYTELANLTDFSACQRAINEIYARHGYEFRPEENSADYEYFNSKSWYQALPKKAEAAIKSELSFEESTNITMINQYRDIMGW